MVPSSARTCRRRQRQPTYKVDVDNSPGIQANMGCPPPLLAPGFGSFLEFGGAEGFGNPVARDRARLR